MNSIWRIQNLKIIIENMVGFIWNLVHRRFWGWWFRFWSQNWINVEVKISKFKMVDPIWRTQNWKFGYSVRFIWISCTEIFGSIIRFWDQNCTNWVKISKFKMAVPIWRAYIFRNLVDFFDIQCTGAFRATYSKFSGQRYKIKNIESNMADQKFKISKSC